MNRFISSFAIRSIGIVLGISVCGPISSATASDPSLNETMVNIGKTMEGLFPVMFDKKDPDKAQQKMLNESIDRLIVLFDNAKPHIDTKSPTYRISFEVIKTQLAHAVISTKYKNYNYTKSILKDITRICTSCHTQDLKARTLFPDVKRPTFRSDYEFAEFNYMTRNYKTAVDFFYKYLDSNPDIGEPELLTIMKQMVTINIQIYYQPDDALALLNRLAKYKGHTKFSRKTLEEWIAGVNDLKKDPYSQKPITNLEEMNIRVQKILGNLQEPGSAQFPNKRERIARLWLRGALYHYLNTHPSADEIPVVLYWLSIVDRSINFSIYYSLADMYLKECIVRYTRHPYARKCFDEYKENIILSYSGSRGTDIPDDIQDELNALEIRLNNLPK